MGLDEPVVPPFPISDYGTGCMGAIAALTGLYRRATEGGSWHGRVSLLQHDILLFKMGRYPESVQKMLLAPSPSPLPLSMTETNGQVVNGPVGHGKTNRDGVAARPTPSQGGGTASPGGSTATATLDFWAMRHSHSVDQISKAAMRWMRARYPNFFEDELPGMLDRWQSAAYGAEVVVVQPVVQIEGLELGFVRASRPNGSDEAGWGLFERDSSGDGVGDVRRRR